MVRQCATPAFVVECPVLITASPTGCCAMTKCPDMSGSPPTGSGIHSSIRGGVVYGASTWRSGVMLMSLPYLGPEGVNGRTGLERSDSVPAVITAGW